MATAATIAAALRDDAETRALMHGLETYRGDAAMYAKDISIAMSFVPTDDAEREAVTQVLKDLNDKFYAQVELCVELLLGF